MMYLTPDLVVNSYLPPSGSLRVNESYPNASGSCAFNLTHIGLSVVSQITTPFSGFEAVKNCFAFSAMRQIYKKKLLNIVNIFVLHLKVTYICSVIMKQKK